MAVKKVQKGVQTMKQNMENIKASTVRIKLYILTLMQLKVENYLLENVFINFLSKREVSRSILGSCLCVKNRVGVRALLVQPSIKAGGRG